MRHHSYSGNRVHPFLRFALTIDMESGVVPRNDALRPLAWMIIVTSHRAIAFGLSPHMRAHM